MYDKFQKKQKPTTLFFFKIYIYYFTNTFTHTRAELNSPTSPGRSVVSRGTCLPGSTSRTCSRASQPCSYPSTRSPPLRVWWSWSNSAEEPSPKLCGRQASASGGTVAEGPRVAASCQSSGCSVRWPLSSTALQCSSVLVGLVFLSTTWKFAFGLKTNLLLCAPKLLEMKILQLAFATLDCPPEGRRLTPHWMDQRDLLQLF